MHIMGLRIYTHSPFEALMRQVHGEAHQCSLFLGLVPHWDIGEEERVRRSGMDAIPQVICLMVVVWVEREVVHVLCTSIAAVP